MTRLSNRQYPMLKIFIDLGTGVYMPIGQAQTFDQRPFRSMLMQGWVAYSPGRGFHITREGKSAWLEFRTTPIERANPYGPLTRYFDPVAYGLTDPYRKGKLHIIAKTA